MMLSIRSSLVWRAGRLTMPLAVLAIMAAGCTADDTSTATDPPRTSETIAPTAEQDAADADDPAGEETGAGGAEDVGTEVQQLENVLPVGEPEELVGGPYTGEHLDGLVISVPAGARGGISPMGPSYFFLPGVEGATGAVFVGQITGVVPPERVGSPIPKDELDDLLTEVPEDLGPYLDAIPQLEVLDSGETASHRWWDIQVKPDLGDTHSECGPPSTTCISLFGEPTGEVTLTMMTDWLSRIAQPIGAPTILLWSTGEPSIGPAAELVAALAEGLSDGD